MAVKSGFFNAQNEDRTYDAVDIARMFDGVISDGVMRTYGDALVITYGSAAATVGVGRAWIDHTWTYNETDFSIDYTASNTMQNRFELIVLEVNHTARQNTISKLQGSLATSPTLPTPTFTTEVKQYILGAYLVKAANGGVLGCSLVGLQADEFESALQTIGVSDSDIETVLPYRLPNASAIVGTEQELSESITAIESAKANKKYIFVHSIQAIDWNSAVAKVTNDEATEGSYITIMFSDEVTLEQVEVWGEALIVPGTQGDGYFNLRALGTVPSITLPIIVSIEN